MTKDFIYGHFSWDSAKEKTNIEKHGLGFREAIGVFADPNRIVAHDDRHSRSEERLFCIGLVKDRVLTIRFTHRGKNIRIFGAGCWRKGRQIYEKTHPK